VVAVERNGAFAARLRERHPGLHVLHASVEHLPRLLGALGRDKADVVLCGLPWAVLDAGTQRLLLRGISQSLHSGGHFVTFGYAHCAVLPGSRRFHRLVAADFTEVGRSPVVWNNLPPAIVYRWRRKAHE
jgi:phospholipid N-methyltransferase